MKPVCVTCQRFYRIKKNGFPFVEGMPVADRVPPGTARPDLWQPYKFWMGDLWKCQGCGSEIVVGVGLNPIAERHEDQFSKEIERSKLQVNDC